MASKCSGGNGEGRAGGCDGLCNNGGRGRLRFQWRNLDFDGSGDGGNDSSARGFGGVFRSVRRCSEVMAATTALRAMAVCFGVFAGVEGWCGDGLAMVTAIYFGASLSSLVGAGLRRGVRNFGP